MPTIEIRRKSVHVLLGLSLVALVWFGHVWALFVLFPLSLVLASKRLRSIGWFDRYMGRFDRGGEERTRAGVGGVWFVAGAIIAWLLFRDAPLVCASLMILTLGDTAASIFGQRFGATPNPLNKRKPIEGSIAGFVIGAFGAAIFVPAIPAVVGALAGMLVEAAEVKFSRWVVDDNLLITLVAAVAMSPLV